MKNWEKYIGKEVRITGLPEVPYGIRGTVTKITSDSIYVGHTRVVIGTNTRIKIIEDDK